MKSITMRIVNQRWEWASFQRAGVGKQVGLESQPFLASAAAAFLGPSPRDASHCLEFDTQVAELASRSYIHTVALLEG